MLILSLIPPVSAIDAPPEIVARQAVVYNPDTDTYVFEKNGDDKAYPTALTKLRRRCWCWRRVRISLWRPP